MPRLKTFCTGALLLLLFPLAAAEIYVVNSASRTLSRIDTQSGTVQNSFAQLGLTPNLMDLDENHIYVACSGDNAVQVVSRSTGALIRYIPVAASSNPWDVLKVGDFLYVTGLFTDKAYKISLQSNSVTGTLAVGTAPEGLCSDGERLYVCNTGGYANNYAGSSISVIDLDTFAVEATVPVWTNPQYAAVRNGFLHVSCTGNWSDIPGKVDIISLESLERIHRLDIGGKPGSLWIAGDGTAYLGDGMGAGLYSYNADTYEVYHDASDPLNYTGSMVSGSGGLIALLEQNYASASVVRLYQSDFTPLGSYNVGLSSSDISVAESGSSDAEDLVQTARPRLYPNPLHRGDVLRIEAKGLSNPRLRIFNLRGQLLHSFQANTGEGVTLPERLAPGVYLYSLDQEGRTQRGKLLFTD